MPLFNQSLQATIAGNTAGVLANISSGTMTLAGGNNITLSQNGNAVTVSAFNQTVQTQNLIDVSLAGNTSGALALISSGTFILAGGNNITLSQNAQSVTISAGAGAGGGTVSNWFSPLRGVGVGSSNAATQGVGTIVMWPIDMPEYRSATQANVFVSLSLSTSSNSSWSGAMSINLAVYTRTGSTFSSASSGQGTVAWTMTSNSNTQSISGMRQLSIPINVNFSPGEYYLAISSSTATTNANWFTASMVGGNFLNLQNSGIFNAASANSIQLIPGLGGFSVSTNAFPAIGISDLSAGTRTSAWNIPLVEFIRVTA